MASSLSRQLSALKADSKLGHDASQSGTATRQSLLVPEGAGSNVGLTSTQVRLLALQGLNNLSKDVPVLKSFGSLVFPPSQV